MNQATGVEYLEDRYDIGDLLGAGAVGCVYAARDRVLGIDVAVKVLRDEHCTSREMLARFSREASVAGRLMSPHTVRMLGLAITRAGAPCIVYERLVGETLADRLDRTGGISLVEVAQVVTQTARALARLHALGVTHCDVKPENIFLEEQPGGRFHVKLLDFGVVAVSVNDGLATSGYGGTPEYIAPEVLRGDSAPAVRSDLYALGVVAFECLTGRCPFVGEHIDEVLWQLSQKNRPTLSDLRPDLGGAVEDWMERALHDDPFWRFASAKEMADGLDRALASISMQRLQLRTAA